MLKVTNTEVFGWEAAIRGMRNPKNSWDRSDSRWRGEFIYATGMPIWDIGPNDLTLMKKLIAAGSDHSDINHARDCCWCRSLNHGRLFPLLL